MYCLYDICPSAGDSSPSSRLGMTLGRHWVFSIPLNFLIPAPVLRTVRPLDLRMRHDAVSADAAKIREALEPAFLHELRHPARQRLDHIRPDGVVEHRSRADLNAAAA